MNEKQARKLIVDTLEAPFDKGKFAGFVTELLNEVEPASFNYSGNYIPDKFKEYISNYSRIGKYFNDGIRVDILAVHLQKTTSLERARTMQRNFVAGYLAGKYGSDNYKDAALVAFVSPETDDWRFSLVKLDFGYDIEKNKIHEEFTPAKRWSFLVGENEGSHTAQSQLYELILNDRTNPSLDDIEQAFNIETVTKEFFLKYRGLFMRTKEELDKVVKKNSTVRNEFANKEIDTVDFAKKLLGQIVFLYFLQKKGWFGVPKDGKWGEGSRQYLRELFESKHIKYKNYFNDILEPLFYDAIAIDHSHSGHWNEHFKSRIPFLNGGLFDAIGGYSWHMTDIELPNSLFSNNNITPEGDRGDGILDIFDRYNFTVNEDLPMEKEVAIDPEMLGKIFEKLGAITPDKYDEWAKAVKSGTGKELEANKKLGVYYTPREIVHYMCQQSLINYLDTELKSPHPKSFSQGEKDFSLPSPAGRGAGGEGSSVSGEGTSRTDAEGSYRYSPKYIIDLARKLRQRSNKPEELMWSLLRDRRFHGLKFRRQHPIDRYIADFYCHELNLVIELDGLVHEEEFQKEYDENRDEYMKASGFNVLRIDADEVMNDCDNILRRIEDEIIALSPHPKSFSQGEKDFLPPSPAGRGAGGEGSSETEGECQIIPRKDIETLIQEGEYLAEHEEEVAKREKETKRYSHIIPETIRNNADRIDRALAEIKICDPAVGSGAFPIGMMHEIVKVRTLLTPYLPKDDDRTTYSLKRECIEKSLYGVDIDRGAVEIAKLRFWLSMVVDEISFENIKPLPNLDYKLVCGNSLLGIERSVLNDQLFQKLETLKPQFFNETNKTKKDALKAQIDGLIDEITEGKEIFDFEVYFSEVFHAKKGFDVVIANPPYVQLQKMSNSEKKALKNSHYETFRSTGDIYCLFYEKGFQLLNKRGVLTFITSNKWMRADYGSNLRAFLVGKTAPEFLIDFAGVKVFDATVDTNILSVRKESPHPKSQGESPHPKSLSQGERDFLPPGSDYSEESPHPKSLSQGERDFLPPGSDYSEESPHPKSLSQGERDFLPPGSDYSEESPHPKSLSQRERDFLPPGSDYSEESPHPKSLSQGERDFLPPSPSGRGAGGEGISACRLGNDFRLGDNIAEYFARNRVTIAPKGDEAWVVAGAEEMAIRRKIERLGTPLKDWDISINYGIKTGYNEAFIIDSAVREELIAKDKKSAEIIVPLLRGRDIKKFRADWKGLWLINSHNGIKEKGIPPINVKKDYPAIYEHLKRYEPQLRKRQDQGDDWTNLRNCAYLEEFEKEKIIFPVINRKWRFDIYPKGLFVLAPSRFITFDNSKSLYYIKACMQSKLMKWEFKQFGIVQDENGYQMDNILIEKFPVIKLDKKAQQPFVAIVDRILAAKAKDPNADTSDLEFQIDVMVYKLYELTFDEVKVIDPDFPLSREEYAQGF